MSEEEKRQHRCCFTGHRPEKLNVSESFVKEGLEKEIRQAIADGMNVFITGMARGTDIWAALIVLRLRQANPDIKLINSSTDGAQIDGFENISLEEVVKNLKTVKAVNLDNYTHNYNKENVRDKIEKMAKGKK